MTVAELRIEAKRLGLRGFSRWRKAELIERIAKARNAAKQSARKAVAKPLTVRQLQAECRNRGLKGWSRLRKHELETLLANTSRLAEQAPTDDEQVMAAVADLTRLDDAKLLARVMYENNSGRPAPQATVQHFRRLEARAVAGLRDGATCEGERRRWADRYVHVVAGC